jgi:hypothetical protein
MATGDLITTEKIQYWLKTGTSTYTKVTEDVTFDPSSELNTYDPTYKDRVVQPSYVTGRKNTVEFEIDLIEGGVLHEFLLENEDVANVATEVVRVFEAHPAYPEWAAETAYTLGKRVIADGKLYECTTAGTSGATAPTWPGTGTVADGTGDLVWTYVASASYFAIGAEGSFEAKKAAFVMTQNPVDGAAGEALRASGTLTMTDEAWTIGTFDPATATFTPEA